MAEAIIKITDNGNGNGNGNGNDGVTINLEFNPPVKDGDPNTPATYSALKIMDYVVGMYGKEDK